MFDKDEVESALAGFELQQRRNREPPPIEYLKEHLAYDPETGVFTWKIPQARRKKGRAGCFCKTYGRWLIRIKSAGTTHLIKASRLAFAFQEGRWPNMIDHINGDPSDDRWENLRECTNAENQKNSRRYKNNKSGVLGVRQIGRRWRVTISVDGKNTHLGFFATLEEAAAARAAANEKYDYHENHGRQ